LKYLAPIAVLFAVCSLCLPQRVVLVAPAQKLLDLAISVAKASSELKAPPTPVLDPWQGYGELKRIASCESWGDPNKEPREFLPDGSVLHGETNPDDIGLAQINLPIWGPQALKLGFDIYSYEGNLKMAKWIFDKYGSNPWYLSSHCWS
jgi:hypothetical protein